MHSDPESLPTARDELAPDERRAADLVQAACDPEGLARELGPEAFEALLADPTSAAEIEAVRTLVGGTRDMYAAQSAALSTVADGARGVAAGARASEALRAARVARRVLARTTREDSGWRGDLRLVGDFVADRLRDSAWLRVAAALLLVQVTVVPMLAYHMLRERRAAEFDTGLVWPEPGLPEAPPEPREEVVAPEIDELPALDGSAQAEIDRLAALAAAVRAELGGGRPTSPLGDVLLNRLVRLELRLAGRVDTPTPDRAPFSPDPDPAVRDLCALVALDGWLDDLRLGPAPEGRGGLEAALEVARTGLDAAAPGSFASTVRDRAAALGLGDWPVSAVDVPPGPARASALVAHPGARGALDDPVVRAWTRAWRLAR